MKNRVEITGGSYKRISLRTPQKIRPTQSIVKRSLFDTLGSFIEDAKVLDVFAGSGAVGFEALSRGAKIAVFIDKSRESANVIKENARRIGLTREQFEMIKADFKKGLNLLIDREEIFDFLFADPPYGFKETSELFKRVHGLMNEYSIFVFEDSLVHESKYFEKIKEVRFGQTYLTYYRRVSGEF